MQSNAVRRLKPTLNGRSGPTEIIDVGSPPIPSGMRRCRAAVLGLLSAVLLNETEMRRRTLLFLLGGAVGWPLNARAQSDNRKKRVGVIMVLAADDPVAKVRIGTFRQALRELGWTEGENLQVDYRWSVGPADQVRIDAA